MTAAVQDTHEPERLRLWIHELEARLARAADGVDDPVIIQVSVLRELLAASVDHLRSAERAA